MESSTQPSTKSVAEKVREVKAKLRLFMNGAVSSSMREKGAVYKLNFGVDLPRLKEISETLEKDEALALALWKEDIRECKILSTLIYPLQAFDFSMAEVWVEQMPNVEIARIASMNLFQKLPFAPQLSLRWIASEDKWRQVCGYHILARILNQKPDIQPQAENEILDQALAAVLDTDLDVHQASWAALRSYMSSSQERSFTLCRRLDGLQKDEGGPVSRLQDLVRSCLEALDWE